MWSVLPSSLLEAALPHAAAVKPNLAFFEAFGAPGMAALERLRGSIPDEVPVVADAKRGDIGSTAARQATALFDVLAADAITVNPYLGEEAIAPLLERADRFAYVLCRTSNPGAGEVQGLRVEADPATDAPQEPLHARIARRAAGWGPGGTVGLVVGATAPDELRAIRAIAPGTRVPRAGRWRPGWGGGTGSRGGAGVRRAGRRAPRRWSAGERVAGHRGRGVERHWQRSTRPAGARRGGRPRVGRQAPCATLAAAWEAAVASVRRTVPPFPTSGERRSMPIGAPELIIILVIALLILGPGKLPEVGASLGKTIREFRKASTDIQESVKVDTSPLPPSQQAPQAPSQSTVVPPVAPVGPITPIETPSAQPPEPGTAANPPTTETVASGAASNADPAPRAE